MQCPLRHQGLRQCGRVAPAPCALTFRKLSLPLSSLSSYTGGVKLILTAGHISLVVAFKGPNIILGLYKCNYSLTVKELKLHAGWRDTLHPTAPPALGSHKLQSKQQNLQVCSQQRWGPDNWLLLILCLSIYPCGWTCYVYVNEAFRNKYITQGWLIH